MKRFIPRLVADFVFCGGNAAINKTAKKLNTAEEKNHRYAAGQSK